VKKVKVEKEKKVVTEKVVASKKTKTKFVVDAAITEAELNRKVIEVVSQRGRRTADARGRVMLS